MAGRVGALLACALAALPVCTGGSFSGRSGAAYSHYTGPSGSGVFVSGGFNGTNTSAGVFRLSYDSVGALSESMDFRSNWVEQTNLLSKPATGVTGHGAQYASRCYPSGAECLISFGGVLDGSNVMTNMIRQFEVGTQRWKNIMPNSVYCKDMTTTMEDPLNPPGACGSIFPPRTTAPGPVRISNFPSETSGAVVVGQNASDSVPSPREGFNMVLETSAGGNPAYLHIVFGSDGNTAPGVLPLKFGALNEHWILRFASDGSCSSPYCVWKKHEYVTPCEYCMDPDTLVGTRDPATLGVLASVDCGEDPQYTCSRNMPSARFLAAHTTYYPVPGGTSYNYFFGGLDARGYANNQFSIMATTNGVVEWITITAVSGDAPSARASASLVRQGASFYVYGGMKSLNCDETTIPGRVGGNSQCYRGQAVYNVPTPQPDGTTGLVKTTRAEIYWLTFGDERVFTKRTGQTNANLEDLLSTGYKDPLLGGASGKAKWSKAFLTKTNAAKEFPSVRAGALLLSLNSQLILIGGVLSTKFDKFAADAHLLSYKYNPTVRNYVNTEATVATTNAIVISSEWQHSSTSFKAFGETVLNSSLASECLSGRTWTTAENPSSGEVRCDHPATMFEVMIQTAKTEIFQPDVTFMSDLYTIQNPVVLASWDVTCSASQNYLYEAHIGAMNGDDSAEIMLLDTFNDAGPTDNRAMFRSTVTGSETNLGYFESFSIATAVDGAFTQPTPLQVFELGSSLPMTERPGYLSGHSGPGAAQSAQYVVKIVAVPAEASICEANTGTDITTCEAVDGCSWAELTITCAPSTYDLYSIMILDNEAAPYPIAGAGSNTGTTVKRHPCKTTAGTDGTANDDDDFVIVAVDGTADPLTACTGGTANGCSLRVVWASATGHAVDDRFFVNMYNTVSLARAESPCGASCAGLPTTTHAFWAKQQTNGVYRMLTTQTRTTNFGVPENGTQTVGPGYPSGLMNNVYQPGYGGSGSLSTSGLINIVIPATKIVDLSNHANADGTILTFNTRTQHSPGVAQYPGSKYHKYACTTFKWGDRTDVSGNVPLSSVPFTENVIITGQPQELIPGQGLTVTFDESVYTYRAKAAAIGEQLLGSSTDCLATCSSTDWYNDAWMIYASEKNIPDRACQAQCTTAADAEPAFQVAHAARYPSSSFTNTNGMDCSAAAGTGFCDDSRTVSTTELQALRVLSLQHTGVITVDTETTFEFDVEVLDTATNARLTTDSSTMVLVQVYSDYAWDVPVYVQNTTGVSHTYMQELIANQTRDAEATVKDKNMRECRKVVEEKDEDEDDEKDSDSGSGSSKEEEEDRYMDGFGQPCNVSFLLQTHLLEMERNGLSLDDDSVPAQEVVQLLAPLISTVAFRGGAVVGKVEVDNVADELDLQSDVVENGLLSAPTGYPAAFWNATRNVGNFKFCPGPPFNSTLTQDQFCSALLGLKLVQAANGVAKFHFRIPVASPVFTLIFKAPGFAFPDLPSLGLDYGPLNVGDGGWLSAGIVVNGICGNGVIDHNDICDDGNTVNGDGCSSTCTVENGFQTVPEKRGLFQQLDPPALMATPVARWGAAMASLGFSTLYMFGGKAGLFASSDLWLFNAEVQEWSEVTADQLASSPPVRVHPTLWAGDGLIFVHGGYDDNIPAYRGTGYRRDFWRYDIDKGSWSDMSTPYAPPPRAEATVTVIDGVAYFFGGRDDKYWYSDLWKHTLATNEWVLLQPDSSEATLRPERRAGHSTVSDGTDLYMFGGFSLVNNPYESLLFNDVWKFTVSTQEWSRLWPPPKPPARNPGGERCTQELVVARMCQWHEVYPYIEPAPRAHVSMAMVGVGTILVYGGALGMQVSMSGKEDTTNTETGDVWEFRVTAQGGHNALRWVKLFDDDVYEVPYKRQRASSGFALSSMWLFGGRVGSTPKSSIYRFNRHFYRADPCLGDGFSGAVCDSNAQCFRTAAAEASCVCMEGYEGSGQMCFPTAKELSALKEASDYGTVVAAGARSCHSCLLLVAVMTSLIISTTFLIA